MRSEDAAQLLTRVHKCLYLPAPEQVKISNLMRVLGEEATMDPTAIEQQVRQQMEERSQVRGRPCGTSQRMSQCIESACSIPALSHVCTCTDMGSSRTPVWYAHACCAHQECIADVMRRNTQSLHLTGT